MEKRWANEEDRPRILDHFNNLGKDNIRLRFNSSMSSYGLEHYVEQMNFKENGKAILFEEDGKVIGIAEVKKDGRVAEFAFSILPSYQGKGLGSLLFTEAEKAAKYLGCREAKLMFLQENDKMCNLAIQNGLIVDDPWAEEIYGVLSLPLLSYKERMELLAELTVQHTHDAFESLSNWTKTWMDPISIANKM